MLGVKKADARSEVVHRKKAKKASGVKVEGETSQPSHEDDKDDDVLNAEGSD